MAKKRKGKPGTLGFMIPISDILMAIWNWIRRKK